MKDYIQTHIHIASYLAIIALAMVIGTGYAMYVNKEVESFVRKQMQEQLVYMLELAEITDRNGADADIENIITDCERRNEYESLLIRLGTLPKKDLVTVQNLFESCGSFYAERKALMVAKLDREFKNLSDLNDFMKIVNEKSTDMNELQEWNELLTLEKTRSALLTDQGTLQADIISELISGNNPSSKEVSALVREAQDISELLSVQDKRIDTIRGAMQQ